MRGRILAAAACAALAAGAAPVFAQPAPPITWVAYTQGKAGKTSDWVKLTLKYDAPIYEKLMAAGVVRSWGIATPINHRPGFGWNLLTWVTVDNWAGVERWTGASMQTMQARSAEETKAIEASYEAVEEAGRHHFDEVVRNAVLVPGKPGAKIGYFLVEHYLARAGQEAALTQLYKETIVPTADKLVADGVVSATACTCRSCTASSSPIGSGRTVAGTPSPTWARSTASCRRSPPPASHRSN